MPDNRYRTGMRVSLISLSVNLALAVIKAGVGLTVQSSALIADAVHSASDALSTLVVLAGLHLGRRPPDPHHPYGHGKAEALATTFLSLSLGATALWLLRGASIRVFAGLTITPGPIAVAAAMVSIAAKEILFHYTRSAGRRTRNDLLLADAWHHRSDALSSVAALIGIVGANQGWFILDPIAAIAVSLLVLNTSWRILRSAIDVLMDRRPDEYSEEVHRVEEAASAIPQIEHVDKVRMRQYGGELVIDLEISVDATLTLRSAHDIAYQLRSEIENAPHVLEAFVHVNPHPRHGKRDP